MAKKITCATLLISVFLPLPSSTAQSQTTNFVQRTNTNLTLDGKPFRYSGPNIEWLGLEGYGPHDPYGPRYPSHFEIDDAFETAAEMGAKVARAQTMGDTVGCPLCIEPTSGNFNPAAFPASDYALASAKQHGIRLIIPLIGDCATCTLGGVGQYLAWNKKQNPQDFFTDPTLITAYEKHIDAVLNHVNPLTNLAYKDDPTILAWEDCNMCGIVTLLTGGDAKALGQVSKWVETIGHHIKSVDSHHLYLDTSGIFRGYPAVLDNPSTDIVTFEYYPHWDALLGTKQTTTPATITEDAMTVTAHGKAYILNEFGWDRTDWQSQQKLQQLLTTIESNNSISGDSYWALQAHNENFGFQPIPADTSNPTYAEKGESGQWWALYYPGLKTLINTKEDMAQRVQILRTHAYVMAGTSVPKHAIPPAPVITSVVLDGLLAWRGSAGAINYSIERRDKSSPDWKTICDRCATDTDVPWADPSPILFGAQYRVIAYNADGAPSQPSNPR